MTLTGTIRTWSFRRGDWRFVVAESGGTQYEVRDLNLTDYQPALDDVVVLTVCHP